MPSKKQKADDNFFSKVYKVARMIPRGRVTSYGAIAEFIGSPGAARMVGWAMNASASQFPPVPAQRVVNRNGLLTGKNHFSYPEQMQELLEAEGVEVVHDRIKNFDTIFWDPKAELPKRFSV